MSRFSGIVDKKTADLGPAYAREIRQVRTATWAAVAQAEHEAWRNDLRRQYFNSHPRPGKFSLPSEGWSAISESRQKPYLAGVRHPHDRTIEDVSKHAPGSRKAFCCALWEVLSPNTDLATCMGAVTMYGEEELETVVSSLLSGHALDVVDRLAELRTTGALVAQIRLLGHARNNERAFDVGCALAQTLCYHAVNPLFAAIAARLWNVVSEGMLEGLRKGQFQFSRNRDGFLHFSETLWERLASAEALYGVHRLALGPRFRWATIVDMNSECIRGFATPGIELPDTLQSFLDVGYANRRKAREGDTGLLFRSTGSWDKRKSATLKARTRNGENIHAFRCKRK